MPQPLPLAEIDTRDFIRELGMANRELARYDGIVQTLPNPDILLSPFMTQEAVYSSRIEGTQATLDEVFEQDAGRKFSEEKKEDIREVTNYRGALKYGSASLQDRPFTMTLMREMHEMLLSGVRGANRTPGFFRKVQNWIGAKGSTPETATYVPPNPAFVEMLMENWLRYMVDYEDIDPLIQAAVMHAQFEMIHPFLDGNGRMGRLLIPLFLYKRGVLHKPIFYMSAYLEAHRDTYCACLNKVHGAEGWSPWIRFFLQGVAQQAVHNTSCSQAVLRLYNALKSEIREATHSEYSHVVLDTLFRLPTFSVPRFTALALESTPGCSPATIRGLLKRIAAAGIVDQLHKGSGRLADIYRFSRLIEIVSPDEEQYASIFSHSML